ncbi:hypothetical protein ACWEO2_25055 [Nocardia sp. NPDC004278]
MFVPDRTACYATKLRGHAPATATTSSSGSPRSKTIAEVTRRRNNLLDERESCSTSNGGEVADAWVERLRHRFAELEHKHRTKNTELDSANERTTTCAKPNRHAIKHDRPGNNRKLPTFSVPSAGHAKHGQLGTAWSSWVRIQFEYRNYAEDAGGGDIQARPQHRLQPLRVFPREKLP